MKDMSVDTLVIKITRRLNIRKAEVEAARSDLKDAQAKVERYSIAIEVLRED